LKFVCVGHGVRDISEMRQRKQNGVESKDIGRSKRPYVQNFK